MNKLEVILHQLENMSEVLYKIRVELGILASVPEEKPKNRKPRKRREPEPEPPKRGPKKGSRKKRNNEVDELVKLGRKELEKDKGGEENE
jgi:hypothetical protein